MGTSNFLDISKEKGAPRIVFKDAKGQECSIQKSNSSLEEKIWFGIDKDFNGKAILGRMELTQEQVSELLPFLSKFAASGKLF
jgi:hypothetical protein